MEDAKPTYTHTLKGDITLTAILVVLAFGMYVEVTKPRPTLLLAGDSVGTCLWLTGQTTMAKIARTYDITQHATAGGTTLSAYAKASLLEDDPDVVLLFAGWCDDTNWGMSDASVQKAVAKFSVQFPRSTVVWVDTRNIPQEWTWDGRHITDRGFQEAYPYLAKAIHGTQDENARGWLSVVSTPLRN